MSLARQGRFYLIIGVVQWLLDWSAMVLISHLGAQVEVANLCGRTSSALLGFWLNGKITFSTEGARTGRTQLQRYVLVWTCNTVISTLALGHIDDVFGIQGAWIAKPAIELFLALVGFLSSRHWIYKA